MAERQRERKGMRKRDREERERMGDEMKGGERKTK